MGRLRSRDDAPRIQSVLADIVRILGGIIIVITLRAG
jgi:hypothetical protein